ncbi:MAG: TetR/AcrR family transcriptional regulator, partial [Pseudomonadota bacterium]
GGFMLRSQMARFMQHGSGLVGVLRMAKNALGETMESPPAQQAPRGPRKRPATQAPVAEAPQPARKPRTRKAAP